MSSNYVKAKLFKPVNTVDIRYRNVLTVVAKPKGIMVFRKQMCMCIIF